MYESWLTANLQKRKKDSRRSFVSISTIFAAVDTYTDTPVSLVALLCYLSHRILRKKRITQNKQITFCYSFLKLRACHYVCRFWLLIEASMTFSM